MKQRTIVTLVAAFVVTALVAPAGASGSGDPRAERDEVRSRKAAVAAQLDAAQASEEELDDAVAALDDEVEAQAANVESARQAVAAAEAEVVAAEGRLADTEVRIAAATRALVERAVESFMEPETPEFDEVISSEDVSEVARKQAMLAQVTATDEDVIDALHLAEEDFQVARAEAEALTAAAAERRTQTEAQLAALEAARADKERLDAEVEVRQTHLLAEIDGLAANEEALNRRIAADEAAAAAKRLADEQARARSRAARRTDGVTPGRPGSGGCIWPISGTVTSGFGSRWGRLHAGVDIAASTGTSIHASVAGVVSFAGVQSGYGNVVVVDHGGGFTTLYAHQSRIAARVGQSVAQGATIGYVGSTGHSTGPHVHFETRYGGSPRDPRICLP